MNRIFKILALSAACTSMAFAEEAGDPGSEDGKDTRPLVTIDPKDVVNKTDNQKANFSGLIDRLENALVQCGMFRVQNFYKLGKGNEKVDSYSVVADDGGKGSNVETPGFFITLTVMQYGFAKAGGVDMYGKASVTEQAKIEFILGVVDMRTKESVKSEHIVKSATGTATAESNLGEQVLQTANQLSADAIVEVLVKLAPFGVMDVEDGDVTIDLPSKRAKPGMQLEVRKLGKKIKNKRTGKMTAKEKPVAVIGVTSIAEDSVTCKLLSGKIEPDEEAEEGCEYDKYHVYIIDAVPVPPQAPPPSPVAPF